MLSVSQPLSHSQAVAVDIVITSQKHICNVRAGQAFGKDDHGPIKSRRARLGPMDGIRSSKANRVDQHQGLAQVSILC